MRRLSYSREICPYAGVALAAKFHCEPLAISLAWRPVPSRAGGKLSALWTVFQVFHAVGIAWLKSPLKWLQVIPYRDNWRCIQAGGGEAFLRRLGTGAIRGEQLAPAFLGALFRKERTYD